MEILLATNNPHKVDEIGAMLDVPGLTLRTPAEMGVAGEPVEDGETFEANALIKARWFAERVALPCLADDSGLVVDALDGRPGIYSSRYAPTNEERIAKLLAELEGVAPAERTARFVCVAALVWPGGEHTEEGRCEGRIALQSAGTGGFGYDPVFLLPERGRTLAEIPADDKNAISHRGNAMRAMRPRLERMAS